MLLNFQKTFAMDVWMGLKRQTIRSAGSRKDVPTVGDVAHCYMGLRTKSTKLLGRWPLNRVEVIRFEISAMHISNTVMGDKPLSRVEREELAKADGFSSFGAMEKWFAVNHEPGEFYGWVIGWAWSKDLAAPSL